MAQIHPAFSAINKALMEATFSVVLGGNEDRKRHIHRTHDLLVAYIDVETEKCLKLVASPRFEYCPLLYKRNDNMLNKKRKARPRRKAKTGWFHYTTRG